MGAEMGDAASRLPASARPPARSELVALDDQGLCEMVRRGAATPAGRAAFAELYARHQDTAMAQAYRMTGDRATAEDIVAEVFSRVLRALSGGHGPRESVLGYVMISLRNEVVRSVQADAGTIPMEPEVLAGRLEEAEPDFADALSERDQIGRAYATLPEETRRVLWLLDVELVGVEDAAEHLGVSSGAVKVLAHRARKKLATAYLQQYVDLADPACAQVAGLLARHVRGELGKRASGTVDAHLPGCPHCTAQVVRLGSLQGQLRAWAGPILAGGAIVGFTLGREPSAATSASAHPAESGERMSAAARAAAWTGLAAGVALLIAGAFTLLPQHPTVAPALPATGPAASEAAGTGGDQPGTGTAPLRSGAAPGAANGATVPGTVSGSPDLTQGGPGAPADDATPNWKLRGE